jgi:hypothetical protein
MDYTYEQAHYPNNVSWYRELVRLDDQLVGEIREPVKSTLQHKVYRVCKYEPLEVADGIIQIAQTVKEFGRVCDAKEFINNGGIA